MVTAVEKLAAAERELALRRSVYPGRIRAGQMTVATARWEIEAMKAIVEDYKRELGVPEQEKLL